MASLDAISTTPLSDLPVSPSDTILPGGITGGAFGTATVSSSNRINPTGITGGAFGFPKSAVQLFATGITGGAFGNPSIFVPIYIDPTGITSRETFGHPRVFPKFTYTAAGGLVLGGQSDLEAQYQFSLQLRYKQLGSLVISKDFTFNLGNLPLYWFRVEGICQKVNAVNCSTGTPVDESGMKPLPSTGKRPIDGSCPQTMIQVVPATTPQEVCQKLHDIGFVWRLTRLSKFDVPVNPAVVSQMVAAGTLDPRCNKLTDMLICQLPQCKEFCLDDDVVVSMGASFGVVSHFYDYPATGGVVLTGGAQARQVMPFMMRSAVTEHASEGLSFGGSAGVRVSHYRERREGSEAKQQGSSEREVFALSTYDITPDGIPGGAFGTPAVAPMLLPHGDTGGAFGHPTVKVPGLYASSWGGSATALDITPQYNGIPAGDLVAPTLTIANDCGCQFMPESLTLSHDLNKVTVFSNFLLRNGMTMPQVVLLVYGNINNSYQANQQFVGISNDGVTKERWMVLFEWACTSILGGTDIGSPLWRFSMLVARRNMTTGDFSETRLMAGFPPTPMCDRANLGGAGLDFTFEYDTQSGLFTTQDNLAVDISVFYDNLDMFATDAWIKNPLFSVNISGAVTPQSVLRQDISPTFPAVPVGITTPVQL